MRANHARRALAEVAIVIRGTGQGAKQLHPLCVPVRSITCAPNSMEDADLDGEVIQAYIVGLRRFRSPSGGAFE